MSEPTTQTELETELEDLEVDAPRVGILMGSKSDMEAMQSAAEELKQARHPARGPRDVRAPRPRRGRRLRQERPHARAAGDHRRRRAVRRAARRRGRAHGPAGDRRAADVLEVGGGRAGRPAVDRPDAAGRAGGLRRRRQRAQRRRAGGADPRPASKLVPRRRRGELGERMAALDWPASPLGPVAGWSPALRTTVGLLLASKAQLVAFWGPELVALYNDAFRPTIGDKHPAALGRPAREGWAELWDDLEPLLAGSRETGEAFSARDRQFLIERRGFLEEVYFDISYDPVRVRGRRGRGRAAASSPRPPGACSLSAGWPRCARSSRGSPGLEPAAFAAAVVEVGAARTSRPRGCASTGAGRPTAASPSRWSPGCARLGTLVARGRPAPAARRRLPRLPRRVAEQLGRALADRAGAPTLELLDRVGRGIVSRLDLHEIVQLATDAATELTGAASARSSTTSSTPAASRTCSTRSPGSRARSSRSSRCRATPPCSRRRSTATASSASTT